ncbi:MAG: cupin fold metalloprotein, WbuC family [Candidatus Riflebacteria bacterium]|nr:cupin fold metalloprotein, WbuC family [Candidatus Riflebacteria bacterium]
MSSYFSSYPYIVQDVQAKSLSFYCKEEVVFLTKEIINELKKIAFREKRNIRISMHQSQKSELHNMIILHHKNTYVRPHKHLLKAEAYHLIEGSQIVFVFNEEGQVLRRLDVSIEGNLLYRFEKNYYHFSVPTSDYVIFHESRIGPFIPGGDSFFAPWAPEVEDTLSVNSYIDNLMRETATL